MRNGVWRTQLIHVCAVAGMAALSPLAVASDGGGGGGGGGEGGGFSLRQSGPVRPTPAPAARATPHEQPRRAAPVNAERTPRPTAAAKPAASAPPRVAARRSGVPPRGERRFVADEALAQMSPRTTPQAVLELERLHNLTRLGVEDLALVGRLYRYRIADGRSVETVIRRLETDRRVASAQPNYLYLLAQTTATAAPAQAMPQFAVEKIRLRQAHETATGSTVAIAIIDSPIDADHPELKGAIAKQFNAIDNAAPLPHSHGTGVAGVIAARERMLGAAPRANILAVAAFEPGVADAPASGSTWRILRGLDWAVGAGARVANMSFAGPQDPLLTRGMDEAHKRGVTLVAAAGNLGPKSAPQYPAADRHVLAVTATDASDRLYDRASGGRHVTLAAPGVEVLTIAPKSAYDMSSGTSIAAAYVSGVAALLLDHRPSLGPDDVALALRRSVRQNSDGRSTGPGLIDASAALAGPTPAVAAKPKL